MGIGPLAGLHLRQSLVRGFVEEIPADAAAVGGQIADEAEESGVVHGLLGEGEAELLDPAAGTGFVGEADVLFAVFEDGDGSAVVFVSAGF